MANGGNVTFDGVADDCWLIRFDQDGTCLSPDAQAALIAALQAHEPCHVILISHGWNNDYEDATGLYTRFMQRFAALPGRDGVTGKVVMVGVIWPSIWAPHDKGPVIAGGDPASDPSHALLTALDDIPRARVRDLLDKPRLQGDEAREFAEAVVAALRAAPGGDGHEGVETAPTVDDVLAAANALSSDGTPEWAAGMAPPGQTAAPGAAAPGAAAPEVAGPRAAGLLDIDPMMAVRVFSVYQMKDRAGAVGANGVRQLLDALLADTVHAIHGVGHSYGCKVLLSAMCVGAKPQRPLASLLLLEPAISHLCFAETVPGRAGPGGYRAALAEDHVLAPLFSTYSRWDMPLHTIFHLALRRATDLGELGVAGGTRAGNPPSVYCALGGYGPRGAGEELIDPLPETTEAVVLPAGHRIYGFDGTLDHRIAGHGDVTTGRTVRLLLEQMTD